MCLIKIVVYIRECSSTLYVGLTGTFRMLIQKYTGTVPPFLRFNFFINFFLMVEMV